MNIKNTFYMVLAASTFSSCHSQDVKYVALDKISKDFDVSGFYNNRIKKTNEIISTDPKSMDKKEALKLLQHAFFVKDTLGYYKSEGRFGTDLYLESINDWMVRKQKPTEIFGFDYRTVAYDPDKDTLAILNKVSFPKMNMVEDKKGNLTSLEVEKTSKNIGDFDKIKAYMLKNCKQVANEDDDQNTSHWESESFYYYLRKKERQEEEILSYDSLGNKKTQLVNVIDITLAMYEKSFVKKMEDLQIYSAATQFWKKPY